MAENFDFQVDSMPTYSIDQVRVSSTRIRELLKQGDLVNAAKLLGRPYSMQGKIVHGDKRGSQMGFPTANINLHRQLSPVLGVFAVRVLGIDTKPLLGAANIGWRPTITGQDRVLLEVYLLDFSGDIYGLEVEVEFLLKIRDEKKFNSLDDLILAIADDVELTRAYFK